MEGRPESRPLSARATPLFVAQGRGVVTDPTRWCTGSVSGRGQNARVPTRYVIDETKAKGYVVVAVACRDESVGELRKAVGRLVLPRQRSLHMKSESERRRKVIAEAVASLPVGVWVVDASGGVGKEPERRARALRVIVSRVGRDDSLVFDRDETMEAFDRRILAGVPPHKRPLYTHLGRHEEPLLALPDVIAWCWARGGGWRQRLASLDLEVVRV